MDTPAIVQDQPSTSKSITNKTQEGPPMHAQVRDTHPAKRMSSNENLAVIQEQDTSSGVDGICKIAEELLDRITERRTRDQNIIQSFQQTIADKVKEVCEEMTEHMYTVYEETIGEMQVMLQELSEVLERCNKLNSELLEATQALAGLGQSLAVGQTFEP